MALVLSGVMFWLYTQQQACDRNSFDPSCHVNISVHPEDRLVAEATPDPNVIIVGIDNKSVQDLHSYPITRNYYGDALRNLEKAGAAVVAFDINFPDQRDRTTDAAFAKALADTKIPVVLAYTGDNTYVEDGRIVQTGATTQPPNPKGIDQIPLRLFRCADANDDPLAPCQKPYPNVILASTDLRPDADGWCGGCLGHGARVPGDSACTTDHQPAELHRISRLTCRAIFRQDRRCRSQGTRRTSPPPGRSPFRSTGLALRSSTTQGLRTTSSRMASTSPSATWPRTRSRSTSAARSS
jgi:hypothetical protein